MKTVIQRVNRAAVLVNGSTISAISTGLLVLIGVNRDDSLADADYLVDKIIRLRIFPDDACKMNRDVTEAKGLPADRLSVHFGGRHFGRQPP